MKTAHGEVANVKVSFVDEENEDIIADILETSHPDPYRDRTAAYAIAAADIVSAKL